MGPADGARRCMLVTGGSGHLGQVVVEVARSAGWRVVGTAFSRPVPGLAEAVLDVRDAESVAQLVDGLRPAAIVHTAYLQDGPYARATVVDGSAAVAQAAAAVRARLVQVSTDVVFDGRLGRPYVEADVPTPITAYGEAKAEAEDRVLVRLPDAVVARTSLILAGPGRPPSTHERLARDPDATLYTNEVRCPVQVDDLAAALVELCEDEHAGVAGVLHVAGPHALSRYDLGVLVAGHAVRGAPAPPDRPLDCRLDSSRAASLLRTRLRGAREVWAGGGPAA
ncbi:MAG TPA: sugar nucleotide-binding protein [Acidimicrobiales bacterium]|nr:sugar nucleotide-binding protein [Acidimicrobiales bacterium]